MQARAVQHQQAHVQGQHAAPPVDQRNAPGAFRSSDSAGRLPKVATPEGTIAETSVETVHRPSSFLSGDEQRSAPISSEDGEGAEKTSSTTGEQAVAHGALPAASSGNRGIGSRFAWSSPNSWASKVAGGVRGGSTGKGAAAGGAPVPEKGD